MATDRFYVCRKCNTKQWISTLFNALYDFSKNKIHKCDTCNRNLELQLTFDFGNGVGPFLCKVLGVFLPEKISKWPNGKNTVKFCPFLVITESIDEGYKSVWLPYWHIVENKKEIIEKKYGQWAPFIDSKSFNNLLLQAKKKRLL